MIVCGETGVAFGPNFVGKGYGKQVINALTEFAKNELGAKKFHNSTIGRFGINWYGNGIIMGIVNK